MDRVTIFETVVGSHIWSMATQDSDTDIFRAYAEPTTAILKGTATKKSKFIRENGKDVSVHEVEKVVEQLLKGNMNFLIGVLSPIVMFDSGYLRELRRITLHNLSKNCFYSIYGMAKANYKKYIECGIDTSERRCNKICRVLVWGINILRYGKVEFKPFHGGTPRKILELMDELQRAYNESTLPEKPDERPFREWLLKLRLDLLHREWRYNYYFVLPFLSSF